MISNAEIAVFRETCRNAERAIKTIETILYKVYDQKLAYDLHCQSGRYRQLQRRAQNALRREGIEPKDSTPLEKAGLWTMIQTNTMFNISTAYIANLVIRDNARGIGKLLKVTHNNKAKGSYANEIANEFMDFEEKNIEKLKSYL